MARYIDADALKRRMLSYYENENTCKSSYNGETLMNYEVADMIEDCIDNAPDVDIMPKAELAKEIFAEMYKVRCEIYDKHIFGGDLEDEQNEAIMDFDADLFFAFEELKKKYGIEVIE